MRQGDYEREEGKPRDINLLKDKAGHYWAETAIMEFLDGHKWRNGFRLTIPGPFLSPANGSG